MESYIQNVLRKKQYKSKNTTMPPVKVEGSLKNHEVVLQAQHVDKSIRMHQTVLKFHNLAQSNKNLMTKQMETQNKLRGGTLGGSMLLLPAVRASGLPMKGKTRDEPAPRESSQAGALQSTAFNQR